MKVETEIKRIMENEKLTDDLKMSKLFRLALTHLPASINQKKVDAAMESLRSKNHYTNAGQN